MTLLRHAVKNLKKEPVVHALTVLQLTAVIVITLIMSSSVMLRLRYYEPFRDALDSNGLYCSFGRAANYDPEKKQDPFKYIADDELKKRIPEIENVISCNSGPSWLVDDNGEPISSSPLALYYDDEVISRFVPDIEEGRWLNTSKKADCIEGVISGGASGIKVGDTVKMQFFALTEESAFQDVHIVGRIPENAKIFGCFDPAAAGDVNIAALYGTAGREAEQSSVIMLSSNYLSEHTTVLQGIFGPALITFPVGCPPEAIEKARQKISGYNCVLSSPLETLKINSMAYLFEQVRTLLPIAAVLLVMVIVSGVSSSALTTRRELKSFAVFCITGLEWKRCALISLIQASLIATAALMLSAASALTLVFSDTGGGPRLFFGWETLFCVIAITAFFLLMSLAVSLLMLSRTTPKQILTG